MYPYRTRFVLEELQRNTGDNEQSLHPPLISDLVCVSDTIYTFKEPLSCALSDYQDIGNYFAIRI